MKQIADLVRRLWQSQPGSVQHGGLCPHSAGLRSRPARQQELGFDNLDAGSTRPPHDVGGALASGERDQQIGPPFDHPRPEAETLTTGLPELTRPSRGDPRRSKRPFRGQTEKWRCAGTSARGAIYIVTTTAAVLYRARSGLAG